MLTGHSILITGASGFLGRAIMKYLTRSGARVIGTIHSQNAKPQEPEHVVRIDLESSSKFNLLTERGPYDAVIHCAAVLPGKKPDLELLIANQRMTLNLIEWTVHNNIPSFFFTSSCSVYGYSDKPFTESTLLAPPNLYAVSKLTCENIIQTVAKGTNTKVCVFRISAPYGPGLLEKTVIKHFLEQGSQGHILTLMGSGSRSQDFVYEDDVARAFFLAISQGATGVFNITGGNPVSMLELAKTVLRLFDKDSERNLSFSGIDPQEAYRGRFSIQAAAKAFGYHPQVSLEEGLRRTAQTWGLL